MQARCRHAAWRHRGIEEHQHIERIAVLGNVALMG
jgi:hypothetical protein